MAPGSPIGYRSDPTGRLCGACGRATRSDSSRTVSLLTTDPSKSFFQSTLRTKHPRDTCMALTDFPGGGKFGRESPKGGHHAERTADGYKGIQTGSSAIGAQEWKIPGASGCAGYVL